MNLVGKIILSPIFTRRLPITLGCKKCPKFCGMSGERQYSIWDIFYTPCIVIIVDHTCLPPNVCGVVSEVMQIRISLFISRQLKTIGYVNINSYTLIFAYINRTQNDFLPLYYSPIFTKSIFLFVKLCCKVHVPPLGAKQLL